jgi:hypothetical protein
VLQRSDGGLQDAIVLAGHRPENERGLVPDVLQIHRGVVGKELRHH